MNRSAPVNPPQTGTHPRALNYRHLRRATRILCARDRSLAVVVARYGAPPLWGRRPGFSTLVRIILEQQVSLVSARALFLRLRDATGDITPAALVNLGPSGLRRLGLTRQKADYCAGLAERVLRRELDLAQIARLPDEEGRRVLLEVRGLGPWSVDIYLLMALRRPDVWPAGDLALAQAAFRLKRLAARPSELQLGRLAERWIPWRSVAARILWHFYLSDRRTS